MSLLKNSTVIISGVVVANGLAYFFNIYTARLLGPSTYGILGSLLALFYIASIIYGPILSVVVKQIALLNSKNKNIELPLFFRSIRREIIFILLGISILVFISAGFLSSYLRIQSLWPIIITGLMILISGMLQFNQSVLTALKQFSVLSKSKVIDAFIRLAIAFTLLYFGVGLNGVLLSFALAYLVVYFWTQKFIPKNFLITNKESHSLDRTIIYTTAIKFFLAGLFSQIAINISSIYIQHYYSSTINGYWTAGMNLMRVSLLFTDAVNQVLYPELVGEKIRKNRDKLIKMSLFVILLITGLSAAICWIMPDFIINLIYGSRYLKASVFLKWQSLLMILISLIQLFFTVYFSKTNNIENIKEMAQ